MGVSYLVAPLDSQMLEWAEKCSVPVKGLVANGKPATVIALKEAAAAIPDHTCQVWCDRDNFQINIESTQPVTYPCDGVFKNTIAPGMALAPATHINGATRPTGEIDWLSFRGDLDLLVAIVRKLTMTCGPQVYFAAEDGIPWLIISSESLPIGPIS